MKFSKLLAATALAGAFAALPQVAWAQQGSAPKSAAEKKAEKAAKPVDPDQDETKDVLVTGSRIPRPAFEGTIPGVTVTAAQLEARSFTNILDALNDVPLVGPGASPFGTNGGQPASLGASFVDLLDLGTPRTLTLVNGRRFVSGNAASLFVAGNATGGQVDLNAIPTALVERTDILTVGGAVAYGSDAIAGVVNLILKDNFKGIRVGALSGVNQPGDGQNYRLNAAVGQNFASGRGNIAASFEYVRDEALYGDQRPNIAANYIAPTSFRNGAVRNGAFVPGFDLAANAGAFLPAASDLVPNNIAGRGYRGGSIIVSDAGAIFEANANIRGFLPAGFQGIATTDPQSPTLSPRFRPQVLINQAGNTNLVPGTPIAVGTAGCSLTLATFCRFAPQTLPGANATQQTQFAQAIITRYAPTFAAQGTQAQRNALALQLLQANTPTPREYLAANPNTNINAFIGSFIPNFLDVANPDAATAAFLPRIAVPLQFNAAGQIVPITSAILADPTDTPSTTGGAVTPDGYNPARFTALRVQQDRYIANVIGHFDIFDNLRFYTENLYARIDSYAPRAGASANTIGSATSENPALVLRLANPFLTEANRNILRAAGVTDQFVISRSNQDIQGDNPSFVTNETLRLVNGLKGSFNVFGRKLNYDMSLTYGLATLRGSSFQIKDIEYALALDAVTGPNGQPICRAQITPGIVGTTPPGVVGLEVVREPGPDGVLVERTIRRTVTQAQVNACQPLNVFGFNQMSQASKDYVLARTGFRNISEQYFAQGSVNGTIFDLPAGPFAFAAVGEYRRDRLAYAADELSRTGATRTAALASTTGFTETYETGVEVRIPVFGKDFTLPFFQNLELNPGVRFVRQDGQGDVVRLLNGQLATNRANGSWNTIYTLGGTWRPVKDVLVRGNFTRSIRQPSVVELFLGGQPAFTGVTDPCSPANITGGVNPDVRRANCQRAVINAGLATDTAGATAFLANYVPSGAGIQGNFTGSPGLLPEKGTSWTVGGVISPRFIPGLTASADYINVEVANQVIPTTIATALQVCYDSTTFPNTSGQVGVNVCDFFNRIPAGRDRQFEVDNGFNSGFINLGGIRVQAVNATLQYDMPIDKWLKNPKLGKLNFYGNLYHLISYLNSPTGTFTDGQQTAGSFGRPQFELQLRGRYENQGFFWQWVWNWQSRTRLFSAGAPVPGTQTANEVQDLLIVPAFGTHNTTMGMFIDGQRRFSLQLTINNVFDTQYVGGLAQAYALGSSNIDNFGRRFLFSTNIRF